MVAQRLMQISLRKDYRESLLRILADRNILGMTEDTVPGERCSLSILVPVDEAGPIMDRIEHELDASANVSVLLLAPEAVLPRPAEVPQPAQLAAPTGPAKTAGVSREELYADVSEGVQPSRVFIIMTVLSALVAAVGLMRDEVAIIIGAMVIAPLLRPNVALALATTLADAPLAWRALKTNAVGVTITILITVGVGLIFDIDPAVPAIAGRTHIGVTDLVVALASGAAATLALLTAAPAALIGVMVAVALMPPLVTFGMLLGTGMLQPALGALLLVTANVVCVNLAGVAMFVAYGVRPRSWWEAERARTATRTAAAIWVLLLGALAAVIYLDRSV